MGGRQLGFIAGAILLAVGVALLLVGCGTGGGTGDTSALPNPASQYCNDLGYQEETRSNNAGEYGVCIFPDGTECDSWDFLAGRCGAPYSYCEQHGGTLQAKPDSNVGTCVFDDGSSCGEFDFFQETCAPGE